MVSSTVLLVLVMQHMLNVLHLLDVLDVLGVSRRIVMTYHRSPQDTAAPYCM